MPADESLKQDGCYTWNLLSVALLIVLKHLFFCICKQYWLIKRIGPAFGEIFRCHIYALRLLVTFCPDLDFNGNKSRFFQRRSPVRRWIYLDRGVTRLSAVPSIQKSEPKIRFSTRTAVFARNSLKIRCLNKFYAPLRRRTAIQSFFCARQSTSAADCCGRRAIIAAVMFWAQIR